MRYSPVAMTIISGQVSQSRNWLPGVVDSCACDSDAHRQTVNAIVRMFHIKFFSKIGFTSFVSGCLF